MIGPESEQWNALHIGGMHSPGVVTVSGPGIVIGWDIKDAAGQKGATTTRIHEPLKKFDAEFELSDEPDDLNVNDFDRWDAFQEMLEASVAGAKPTALDVYHPDLARVHITAATVASIGLMALDGRGGGKVKVAFIEYAPPKPARVVAQTKTAGDKVIDDQLKQIDNLNKQYEKL